MKEEHIKFETAKLAKEKGFFVNNKNTKMYKPDGKIATKAMDYMRYELYSKVTQSLLQKWLREKHEIFVTVNIAYDDFAYLAAEVWGRNKEDGIKILLVDGMTMFQNYEEALEEGLQEALKSIK